MSSASATGRSSRNILIGLLSAFTCLLLALGIWAAMTVVPVLRAEAPVVDHVTARDLGVSGPGTVENLMDFSEARALAEENMMSIVRAGGSLLAVAEDGVSGIDYPDGEERWRYQVSGTEVAVGFLGEEAKVVVAHTQQGILGEEITEVVLDASTGEIEDKSVLSSSDAPADLQSSVTMGTSSIRIVVAEGDEHAQLVAYERGGANEERWRVDPSDYCEETALSRDDFEVTMDRQAVFLSILCAQSEEVQAVSLSLASGETESVQSFSSDGAQRPPEVAAVNFGVDYGTDADPITRVLSGELASNYLFVSSLEYGVITPPVWEIESVSTRFPAPSPNTATAPGTFLFGEGFTIDLMLTYQATDILLHEDILTLSDFDDSVVIEEEDGSQRLFSDPLENASQSVRVHLQDALTSVAL